MQPRAPGSFLCAPGNGIFVHWTWAALKSTEQKLILKVIRKGINGRLALCYSCVVLKEHLKWLGFSAQHFLFLMLLGFWGVWVFVLAVAQAYVPPEKHDGWLGNPYIKDVRVLVGETGDGQKWEKLGGWGLLFAKRQPGLCLLLNFIPVCPVLCATRFTH